MAETWQHRAARSIVTSLPPTDSIVDKMEWYTRIITQESAPVIDALTAQVEAMRPVVDRVAEWECLDCHNSVSCQECESCQARAAQEKIKEIEKEKKT